MVEQTSPSQQKQPALLFAGGKGNAELRALCAFAAAQPQSFIDNLDWELASDLSLFERIDADEGLAHAFQSPSWLRSWLETVGAAREVEIAVICGQFGKLPLIVVPLCIEKRGPFFEARFIAQDISDYNEPLFHRELEPHVSPALMGALWRKLATLVPADYLALSKLPRGAVDPTTGRPLRHGAQEVDHSHWLAVADPWEAGEDRFFGASSRHSMQRKEKKLAKIGELAWRTIDDADEREGAMAQLVAWKAGQLAHLGDANRFRDGAFIGFLKKIAADSDHARYRLYGLFAGKEALALTFMVCGSRRWFLYQTAYTDGEAGRFSPGLLLLRHVLRQAHDAGIDGFDFGLGNEGYKQRFCDRLVTLYRYSIPITLRGRVAVPATHLFAAMRDVVRTNVHLRRLVLSVLRKMAMIRGR